MPESSFRKTARVSRGHKGLRAGLSISAARRAVSLACALLVSAVAQAGNGETEKQIFGWVERVLVTDHGISLRGKLDTGAKTSSLHATNITPFKRDDIDMVRYDVTAPREDRVITMESPLVRRVAIKEQGGAPRTRPIVHLWICIGDISRVVEVNLVDRSRFNYPLLIGRTALADMIVVDPGESFTRKPTCSLPEKSP